MVFGRVSLENISEILLSLTIGFGKRILTLPRTFARVSVYLKFEYLYDPLFNINGIYLECLLKRGWFL